MPSPPACGAPRQRACACACVGVCVVLFIIISYYSHYLLGVRLTLAHILSSRVPSVMCCLRSEYNLPAKLNTLSAEAEVAGQPRNWRAMRATCGKRCSLVDHHWR